MGADVIAASSTRESDQQLSRGQTLLCAKCLRPLTDKIAVPLWDARTYCEICVENECPGLAQIARSGEPLHEEMSDDFNSSLPTFFSLLGPLPRAFRIMEVVGIFFAWGIARAAQDMWIGIGLTAALIMLDVVFALLIYRFVGPFTRSRPPLPWVHAENGHIVFGRGHSVRAGVLLNECQWRESPSQQTPWGAIPPGGLILLVGFRGGWPNPKKMALCGFSPQMKAYWRGFLALAGVPRMGG